MMKNITSTVEAPKALPRLFKPSRALKPFAYTLIFLISINSNTSSANRFAPPSLKQPLVSFDSRINGDIFNVDFLLAHIINNGRKTVREVGELTDEAIANLQNTEIFTNDNTTSNGASAGSVIIPPGTSADTIIIINQNEGDSIAIQR